MKLFLLSALLLLSVSGLQALDTLTIRQIYDFDAGDTFHYHILSYGPLYSNPTSSLFTVVITGRWYSPGLDTIFYARHCDGIADTICYTHLDTKISLTDTPSQLCPCFRQFRSDTACGGTRDDIFWSNGGDYFDYVYISGLGRVVGAYGRDDGRQTDTSLNSYIKASRQGQTPYYYTGLGEAQAGKIRIYPDPARDEVHLSFPALAGIATLSIQDAVGRVVNEYQVLQAESIYDISTLPPGIYLWQIWDSRGVRHIGRLVKQ